MIARVYLTHDTVVEAKGTEMILGFDHYNIRAKRQMMELLKVFYRDVVGLTLGHRPPLKSFGYWLYAGDKDVLHLSEAADEEFPAENITTTFDHVAFRASDYAASVRRLESLGITFRVREIASTGTRQVFFKDPAGNGVELNFSSQDN